MKDCIYRVCENCKTSRYFTDLDIQNIQEIINQYKCRLNKIISDVWFPLGGIGYTWRCRERLAVKCTLGGVGHAQRCRER